MVFLPKAQAQSFGLREYTWESFLDPVLSGKRGIIMFHLTTDCTKNLIFLLFKIMSHFNFLDIFIIIVIIIIIILYIKRQYGEVSYVKSQEDGQRYLVKKLPDSQKAAEMLARINKTKLVKHVISKYPDNEDAHRLYENFNPENVSEGLPDAGYTSYSVNKGERLILCIRQKDSNNFVDENVAMYVAIHELAHIAISEIGHTPYFWKTFKWLLEESIEVGVYEKVDYAKYNQPYCGITLTTSVI